ncbi:MAG: 1-acyl-sn-glycerol-3-phosphate acyltransferase [Candidatus Omnitrophica bacterium]|nr:1-acyl-sn-glycerol-3-phosphate acyltransferase [Candidatus Omnitrophota bacterium]
MFYWFIRTVAVILFKVYFRIQVSGRENIPATGGFILAANHASYLDPPLVAVASPRQLSFLAMEQLFKIPLFGPFIRALNAVPLNTKGVDTQTIRWAVQVLRQGKVITIFPEGSRTPDGKLLKPQAGVGFLAVKTKAPIVPVYIDGSFRAMPMHSKMIWPKKITIYIGPQIRTGDLNASLSHREVYAQIAEKTMQEIKNLKERLVKLNVRQN